MEAVVERVLGAVVCARCRNPIAAVRAARATLPGRAPLACVWCLVVHDPGVDSGVSA